METLTITGLRGFPSQLLKADQKVVSLFTAAFLGSQDIAFIHAAGVKNCLMVDNDADKLSKIPYPFGRLCADCYETIDNLFSSGQRFDLITCDQWTTLDKSIHEDYFEKICAIAPLRVLSISQPYMNTLRKLPDGIYYKRSEFKGGVYWRVV